jgi:glutaconate CoA-transferase subunit B
MDYKLEELLICCLSRKLGKMKHIAIGAASPIPAGAAFMARELENQTMHITLLASQKHNHFTDGSRELFDAAAQGRIDAFFLGGVQIDGKANINLVGTGEYPETTKRFPGSFGSALMYYVVPSVFLFRLQHNRRSMVEAVDFISAPGFSPPEVYRPGGPVAMITDKCLFSVDRERQCFSLESLHPGVTLEEVKDLTEFKFDHTPIPGETLPPTEIQLELLRSRIAIEIAESYPLFAKQVFDI